VIEGDRSCNWIFKGRDLASDSYTDLSRYSADRSDEKMHIFDDTNLFIYLSPTDVIRHILL
jgi:hypothetical protein